MGPATGEDHMFGRIIQMILMRGLGRYLGGRAGGNLRHVNRAVRMARRMRR